MGRRVAIRTTLPQVLSLASFQAKSVTSFNSGHFQVHADGIGEQAVILIIVGEPCLCFLSREQLPFHRSIGSRTSG